MVLATPKIRYLQKIGYLREVSPWFEFKCLNCQLELHVRQYSDKLKSSIYIRRPTKCTHCSKGIFVERNLPQDAVLRESYEQFRDFELLSQFLTHRGSVQ